MVWPCDTPQDVVEDYPLVYGARGQKIMEDKVSNGWTKSGAGPGRRMRGSSEKQIISMLGKCCFEGLQ